MKHFGKWNVNKHMHFVFEMSCKFLHSTMCFLNTLQIQGGLYILGTGKGHSN